MKFVALASVAAVATATTVWHAEYGLTAAEERILTDKGCFRGSYAGSLSLTTCESSTSVRLAETEDDARLCVMELKDPSMLGAAKTIATAMTGSKALLSGSNHLVMMNSEDASELSPACTSFNLRQLANNVINVPTFPIVATPPMPVNHRAVQRSLLKNSTSLTAPDPLIQKLVNSYSSDDVSKYLKWASTDYQGGNAKITRNSYATRTGVGGCADSTWRCSFNFEDELVAEINDLMKDYPNDWEVEKVSFRSDMCSNIVVKISGEKDPAGVVIIGAHFDSRNTGSGSTATGPAPGADDNGSGTAAQLAILKNMAENPNGFYYSVHLMWFCGEEQGLLGSAFMARDYKTRNVNVIGMFNNDMIGYTNPANGMTLSFMKGNAEAWLSNSCKEFSNTYVPALKVADTNVCCSDQQSFYQQGFAAAGIFETPTASVVYPQYHRTGDTWDNGLVNMQQVYLFGQANYACIMEYAIPLAE